MWKQFRSLFGFFFASANSSFFHPVIRAEPTSGREYANCEHSELNNLENRRGAAAVPDATPRGRRQLIIPMAWRNTGILLRPANRFSRAQIKIEIGRHSKDLKSPDKFTSCHSVVMTRVINLGLLPDVASILLLAWVLADRQDRPEPHLACLIVVLANRAARSPTSAGLLAGRRRSALPISTALADAMWIRQTPDAPQTPGLPHGSVQKRLFQWFHLPQCRDTLTSHKVQPGRRNIYDAEEPRASLSGVGSQLTSMLAHLLGLADTKSGILRKIVCGARLEASRNIRGVSGPIALPSWS